MTDYIVYVKMRKNKRLLIGNARLTVFSSSLNNKEGKLIYFEVKKNLKVAQCAESKFRALTRNKLIEKIRLNNPEFLDLRQTLNNNMSYLKESIY